ncbi:MAG: lysylphosphatidylglycerol synthase transmembrane domain-containing protein [Methanosarcinales archaeon]|nr:lysylphosphatidylglycerol synthase transmembrane domain-containing protein [Methanosarcinales archaeon]
MVNNEQPVSPIKRLAEPRTLFSFAVALFVLYFLFSRIEFDRIIEVIQDASPGYIIAAAAVYFGSLPVRGERWRLLLNNIGVKAGLKDASEIFMLSWFANTLVPAKMGDVYRGYLAKKAWGIPISKSFGTVYVERIYDVLLLVILMGVSSIMVFGTDIPQAIRLSLAFGFAILVILVSVVVGFSSGKTAIARRLPARFEQIFTHFAEGLHESAGRGSVFLIIFYTIAIWGMETVRLYFVVASLSSTYSIGIGISLIVFVALSAALVSALPITPSGLGAVEFAIVGVLVLVGVDVGVAAGIAILDRAVSYWGLVVLGAMVYVVSGRK